MSELIVAGFDDGHTAFLARAILARLQDKLALPGHEMSVITREKGNEVTLQQAINLGDEAEAHETFWKILADLLFVTECLTDKFEQTAAAKLTAIGIDEAFRRRVAEFMQPGTAALLVLVSGQAMRDEIIAVLRGFQGEIAEIPLIGDGRETLLRILQGQGKVER